MAEPFAYDVVDYPTAALSQAHPSHLFALAHMFGLDPAPVERCRYLEVGCGDGVHLIGCALGLPDATFVGMDLSAAAIERGNRIIAEIGLHNVSLYAADLTQWEPPEGGFDYIIAHGLYSWVPPVVRDALLALYARCLPPHGIGYVSYNAYPGCFVRRMVWEILRQHTAHITEPAAKITQARELLKFLLAAQPAEGKPMPVMYRHELDDLLNDHPPSVLYHDDLSEVNDPVYLREFVAHAGRFGLRFVAEAEQAAMEPRAFPNEVAKILHGMAERDVILKEQYIDYLRLRRFRQTLLSPDGRAPQARPDPARITELAVSGKPQPEAEPVDLSAGVAVTFRGDLEAAARTDSPQGKAALVVLGERWPARIPFPELVRTTAGKLGREPIEEDTEVLAGLLSAIWMTGMVELHGHCPRYAETVSERPVANPLARIQVRTTPFATTLLHAWMRIEDAPSRRLIELLDGTRDREQLAADLLTAFPQDAQPDPATLNASIDRNLDRLARAGLLIG